MRTSLLTTAVDGTLSAVQRLRGLWFTLAQTSVAAGLAWYIAHDVLDHRQPFFAPVAAAVCLSASNVLRGIRAIQMMIGVALGIGIGAMVQGPLGTGSVGLAAAVFIALGVAVSIGHGFIAQGLMFVNQTAVSAILVLVLALSRTGVVYERLFDAMIGGGLALVFAILLFPANPLTVLHEARDGVLATLHDILDRTAGIVASSMAAPHGWPSSAIDRVHEQLGGLIQARTTARQVVRVAPRRWGARGSVKVADEQAAQVSALAVSVLHLTRAVTSAPDFCDRFPQPMHAALADLAAGTAVADEDRTAATAHAAAARSQALELESRARDRTDVVLADIVHGCANDLQRVIDLPGGQPSGRST
jgi:uncharacterized membrane protein YgaE (UPF0421/DUF939 family)